MLLYRVARNTQTKVMPLVDRADPILVTTRQILEENKPRIAEVSVEAVEIAKTARRQVDRIGELLAESSERAKARLAQIDRTVDETVEQVEQVGDAVKTAVLKPVKEVNGLMAGMKAALSRLTRRAAAGLRWITPPRTKRCSSEAGQVTTRVACLSCFV